MRPPIPPCTWTRPIGLGWEHPYTVRYKDNLDDGPWHGMPLGGFGAGCLGRSSAGDFNLWHIDGGEHLFGNLPACQFAVFESTAGQQQAYALSTTDAPQSWQPYPASTTAQSTGSYQALYPRSWFCYENVLQSSLTCEQFSPILPDNYRETSYPTAVFDWTIHNPTAEPITIAILLSWQNTAGWFRNTLASPEVRVRADGSPIYEYQSAWEQSAGSSNSRLKDAKAIGIIMSNNRGSETAEGDGQWCIATQPQDGLEVFVNDRWNPSGDGAELWTSFAANGSIPEQLNVTAAIEGEQIAGAIAVRVTLAPGETRQIPFVLTWDFPVTEFAQGTIYHRRYTDFFDRSGQNAGTIAIESLANYRDWQAQIMQWQQPILERSDLDDWFKMALFNELYDLTDGGALWTAASPIDPVGQYAVLECIDYRWYESLDVRLYGSFGLLMLWPELEKAVMRAFARAIPAEDDRTRLIGYYLTIGTESPNAQRKTKNATPHDLGAPNEHPWGKTNYTSYQDCNLWKDLGSDFVLQVYRDYLYTGRQDITFLQDCWPAIVAALEYLKTFDLDNDGIPENSGAPDQTFDDWRLQGISAYCGGLWIAALEAAIAIGQLLIPLDLPNLSIKLTQFQTWLAQSKPLYQAKLWNGDYYRLDSDSGSPVVMADQLCGQFYARLLELPDIVPIDCAKTALQTVYDSCFVRFNDYVQRTDWTTAKADAGRSFESAEILPNLPSTDAMVVKPKTAIGAANGVRPDGSPDNPNATHPLEVWTGINFGLAAFFVQMGQTAQAMEISRSVVEQIYDNGLQFRTPEAITATGTFRASHYLRAMAIWAIYQQLTLPKQS
jgi:non-lysosomal glucosylceramidase